MGKLGRLAVDVVPAELWRAAMSPDEQVLHLVVARIERAECPKCEARMMLARIMPCGNGCEIHQFDCPKCNHALTIEVPEPDPLKAAQDWFRTKPP